MALRFTQLDKDGEIVHEGKLPVAWNLPLYSFFHDRRNIDSAEIKNKDGTTMIVRREDTNVVRLY